MLDLLTGYIPILYTRIVGTTLTIENLHGRDMITSECKILERTKFWKLKWPKLGE